MNSIHITGRVLSNTPAALLLRPRPLAVGDLPQDHRAWMPLSQGDLKRVRIILSPHQLLFSVFLWWAPSNKIFYEEGFCALKIRGREASLVQSNLYICCEINLDRFQTRKDLSRSSGLTPSFYKEDPGKMCTAPVQCQEWHRLLAILCVMVMIVICIFCFVLC